MKVNDKYDQLREQGIDKVKVKLISGRVEDTMLNSLVGFCYCNAHKGYITKNLLKKHECIEKQCPFLRKFEDYPYWIELQQKKEKKEQIKAERKLASLEEKRVLDRLAFMRDIAQEIAAHYHFPIYITSITPDKKYDYVVNYVSDSQYNDWHKYLLLALKLNKCFDSTFRINHIKTINGTYATINDIANKKKLKLIESIKKRYQNICTGV